MKKYLLPFLMMMVLAVGFSSCKKDNTGTATYAYVSLDSAPAESVTPVSAKLNAEIRFVNVSGGKMFLSFFYSEQKFDRYSLEYAKRTDLLEFDAKDGKYSIEISGLKPNTTYYYIPYLSVAGIDLMDKLLNFTTLNFCMTKEATPVETTTATINAMAVLTAEQKAMAKLGFQWTCEDFDGGETHDVYLETTALDDKGNFSYAITGLTANTVYYVRAFVSLDGRRHYANILSFKTNAE